mmetsp:Transcript_118516/g.382609  ORF Transcript_118516/g.382609 Transcript_118516/m.382609 type:complete len:243 (+) Transcript_118516:188-916(+)
MQRLAAWLVAGIGAPVRERAVLAQLPRPVEGVQDRGWELLRASAGSEVLLELLHAGGAQQEPISQGRVQLGVPEQPRVRGSDHSQAMSLASAADPGQGLEIGVGVEPRQVVRIALEPPSQDLPSWAVLACQKPRGERIEGDEADGVPPQNGQQVLLHEPVEGVVETLVEARHGPTVSLTQVAQPFSLHSAVVAQTQLPHLPLADECMDALQGLREAVLRVRLVKVQYVHPVGLEGLQRCLQL